MELVLVSVDTENYEGTKTFYATAPKELYDDFKTVSADEKVNYLDSPKEVLNHPLIDKLFPYGLDEDGVDSYIIEGDPITQEELSELRKTIVVVE